MTRRVVHPGPVGRERIIVVPCRAERFEVELAAGIDMNSAVAEAFRAHGFESGFLRLANAAVDPLRYVMPAAAVDAEHAAWYSEIFAPQGECLIEEAGFTVGLRDGQPWFHCHGVWQTPDLGRRAGHLLPLESRLARAAKAQAWGVTGAAFEVGHDPETNFSLFSPVRCGNGDGNGRPAALIRVCPNGDFATALKGACCGAGIGEADVMGVGSFIEAHFRDALSLASYATEAFIRKGAIAGDSCDLDICVVGIDGAIGEGLLAGENPVCVTFEALVVTR